jgi:hypothetical protein
MVNFNYTFLYNRPQHINDAKLQTSSKMEDSKIHVPIIRLVFYSYLKQEDLFLRNLHFLYFFYFQSCPQDVVIEVSRDLLTSQCSKKLINWLSFIVSLIINQVTQDLHVNHVHHVSKRVQTDTGMILLAIA